MNSFIHQFGVSDKGWILTKTNPIWNFYGVTEDGSKKKQQNVLHPVYREKNLKFDQINTAQEMRSYFYEPQKNENYFFSIYRWWLTSFKP